MTNDVWRSFLIDAIKDSNSGIPIQIFDNGVFQSIVVPNNVTPTSSGHLNELCGHLTGTELSAIIDDYIELPHSGLEENKSLKEKRDDQKEELLKFVNKRPRNRK